jgi:2-keto-4-pentenoate hydratase/2-oxohepta-3-ene-1,7-dioic acid hydratase in catechol pathway
MENFKLGRYEIGGRIVVGQPCGDYIDVVSEEDNLARVLAQGITACKPLRRVAADQARIAVPIDPSSRVFAIAVNYVAHGVEAKAAPPSRPLIFYKAPSNFVAHGANMTPNLDRVTKFDYEGEIGVVIGRPCKDATFENALDFVTGVCAVNDGSARNLTKVALGNPETSTASWPDWTAGKAHDGASAVGPTIDCNPDALSALRARSLKITTRLNGDVVQDGCMDEMIFSTEEIIVALSSYMVLLPGDIIATGAPAGVGLARNRLLQSGDALEFEVSGLDVLNVGVA